MSDPREQLMLKYGYPILPFIGEGDSSHTKRNKWFDEDTQIPNCKKTDIIIFFQKKYDKFLDFEQLESECRKGKVKIVPSEFLEEKKKKWLDENCEEPKTMSRPDHLPDSDSDSDSDVEPPSCAAPAAKGRPKKPIDSFMALEERFDQHKLNHIIQHEDKFRGLMRDKCFDDDYNPFAIAKKYLIKSHEGKIDVRYKQNEGIGRFHAMGSLSMQGMPREVRHTIALGKYTDIDMKNAHPVILLFLCQKRNILTPHLQGYVEKRDEMLAEVSDERETAKTTILSMINGGMKAYNNLPNKPSWLKKFKNEIDMIHGKFAEDKEFKPHKKKRTDAKIDFNHEASYMNVQLCDFENNILMVIWEALGKPKNCVLCFDGLMVGEGTVFDLRKLETKVEQALKIKIELTIKEMNEGFELGAVETYEDPKPPTTFDFNDSCSYQTFQNDFKEREFASWEDAHEVFSAIYPKVIARVLRGEGSYVKKLDDGEIDVVKKLGNSDFNIYISSLKPPNRRFSDYLFMHNGFGNYVCKLIDCKPTDFNLWTGFGAKRTDVKPDSLELIKQFFMETWAAGNQDYYNYLISWFAGLFTNVRGINMVALAMIALPGTGKGFFLSFMRNLVRAVNMAELTGVAAVVQKHNTAIRNKRLVVINEMSSTKDEFKSNFDKIKSLITDPRISIEPKCVDGYQIDNISNFLLFSNHRDSIILEERDRRYAVFEMSDVHINDTAYFDALETKTFNQETYDAFYTYLLDFPAVSVRSIPDTDLRREMINLSKPTPLKFLDAVLRERGEEEEDLFDGEGSEVSATLFYTKYQNWCQQNGERNVYTSTKFGTCLQGKIEKKKMRSGMVYVLTRT